VSLAFQWTSQNDLWAIVAVLAVAAFVVAGLTWLARPR
jgi:hypothetical protein